jgi:hypothetical protein
VRIDRFRSAAGDGRTRTEALVTWEDADRPPATVFFEVTGPAARAAPDPNAFVAAAALPAFRRGERRISVEGSVCPRLRDGIAAATGLLRAWYSHPASAPTIEPDAGFAAPRLPSCRRAAILTSGGLDSLFSILQNRRHLGRDHPRSFRDAFRIRDLMFPVDSSPARRAHIEQRSACAVETVAAAADLEVTEVTSNVTALEDDFETFARWTHGSVLARAPSPRVAG